MVKELKDVVTWLKQWFYDIGQVDSLLNAKANKNLGSAGKNVVTDGSGNITTENKPTIDTAMSSTSTNAVQNKVVNTALGNKVDKTNGASQMKDGNAGNYTRLGNFNANTTQQTINSAINTKIGQLLDVELVKVVSSLPEASASTMNTLYVVPTGASSSTGNQNIYHVYITVKSTSNVYTWEKVDDADLQSFITVTQAENTYARKSHASTNGDNGKGTGNTTGGGNFGHVRLIRNLNQQNYIEGHALSAEQGYALKDMIQSLSLDDLQDVEAEGVIFYPSSEWGEWSQGAGNVQLALDVLMGEHNINSSDITTLFSQKADKSEAITDIELVPKGTNTSADAYNGVIRLKYASDV